MIEKKRYTFSPLEKRLPLYIDSIGYNPYELDFDRPEGFPSYQWLQTVNGEGLVEINGQEFILKKGCGFLLAPYTPHRYQPNYQTTSEWSTIYLTFSGSTIEHIMDAIEMNNSFVYHEIVKGKLYGLIQDILNFIATHKNNLSTIQLDLSAKTYNFIISLKKYIMIDDQITRIHSYEKIKFIVEWLEQVYSENIGLLEISQQAKMSSQHLNTLFHETFNLSPYAFLVKLRIREAKRLLLTEKDMTLKEIANLVGFNSVSHFVSTFKNHEGITPRQHRELHDK